MRSVVAPVDSKEKEKEMGGGGLGKFRTDTFCVRGIGPRKRGETWGEDGNNRINVDDTLFVGEV